MNTIGINGWNMIRASGLFFRGEKMDKDTKEIVKAIEKLTKELKRIRELMISWDEVPPVDEADPDKYIA